MCRREFDSLGSPQKSDKTQFKIKHNLKISVMTSKEGFDEERSTSLYL